MGRAHRSSSKRRVSVRVSVPSVVPSLALVAPFLLAGVAFSAACGARGPLDDDAPLDAGAGDVVTVIEPAEAAPPVPDAAPPVDAAPEGGSIIGCGTCLFTECAQGIAECVQDTKCRTTIQCVVTDCLAGGGTPSPACLFQCAQGDVQGALKIFQIFQCVTSTCGADCNPLLSGGLGGLGGLGGGGGGGGGGGAAPDAGGGAPKPPLPPFASALSQHWPQICEPLERPSPSTR